MTDSVTGLPPKSGPARDAAILAAVDSGAMQPVWTPIQSSANNHVGTFYVLSDSMKMNGVRVSVSARILQQIADKLNASLMTPRLLDLAFQQAAVVIPPCPIWPNDDTTECMDRESAKMDQYIAGQPGSVAPTGKNWVISNALVKAAKNHAALYGWAVAPQYASIFDKSGVKTYAGTVEGIKNIQPLATPHDMDYVDYAMLISLVKRACIVDGNNMDIRDVLVSADYAPLASHEGVLKVLRQPGISELSPIDSSGGPNVSGEGLISCVNPPPFVPEWDQQFGFEQNDMIRSPIGRMRG